MYKAIHRASNVSIVTIIVTDQKTNKYRQFLTVANIGSGKTTPVANVVFISNKTTLSEYYKILAKTINRMAINDRNNSRSWHLIAKDLMHLSIIVKKELPQYNKSAKGLAIVIDGFWSCFANCLLLHAPSLIKECWDVCAPCITFPNEITCIPCMICVGVQAVECIYECY